MVVTAFAGAAYAGSIAAAIVRLTTEALILRERLFFIAYHPFRKK
jgi:hypothetical protein